MIRRGGSQDVPFLRDMLRHAYYARWGRDETAGIPLSRYVEGWGRRGDTAVIEIERFLSLDDFGRQVADLVAWVKSAEPAPGGPEVLVPGEPEARSEARRRAEGIPVEDETWRQIEETAAELGVA